MSSIAMAGLVVALVRISTGFCCGVEANCTGAAAGTGALLLTVISSGVPMAVLRWLTGLATAAGKTGAWAGSLPESLLAFPAATGPCCAADAEGWFGRVVACFVA